MSNPDEHKGIKCMNPACGAVDSYKSRGQMRRKHEHVLRNKECTVCGTIFELVEAPVRVVTISNNHIAQQ